MNFLVSSCPLPEGWVLTHLILLDPEWQANLRDEDSIATATGDTPEVAIALASSRAERGEVKPRYVSRSAPALVFGLMAKLGLVEEKIKRRKI